MVTTKGEDKIKEVKWWQENVYEAKMKKKKIINKENGRKRK